MKVKKVAIIPHVAKKETPALMKEILRWLSRRQVEAKVPKADAEALGLEEASFACFEKRITGEVDLVITLGGDGTFLRAARLLGGKATPILGVNLGKFGFLSEVEITDLYTVLSRVLEGEFFLERRMMLDCGIFWRQKKVSTYYALNEIVINRSSKEKLLQIDVYINDVFFNRYSADGIIFATPTGSTAYSLSAGGPVVSPREKLIIMTPVCPHSFFNRSLVLSKSDEVKLSCPDATKESNVTVSLDGVVSYSKSFDFVRICTSKSFVNLVRVRKCDFYTALRDKLSTWSLSG